MEMIDYEKVYTIIDRMIGSWAEQGAFYRTLSAGNRINADNQYTMMRKKLITIAETCGIDFLADLERRMKYVWEERGTK